MRDLRDSHVRSAGFTLIELSVVLVIIGFIVGGVLVGKDLITAAQVRSEIKQMQDLQTQVATFQNKYNCLPGDCTNITTLLGTTDAQGHTITNGDGDGLIRSTAGSGAPYPGNECLLGGLSNSELPQVFLQLNDGGIGNYISNGTGFSMNVGWGPLQAINNGTGLLITCLGSSTFGTNSKPSTQPLLVDSFLGAGNIIVLGAYPNPLSGNNRLSYITGVDGDFGAYAGQYVPIGIPINFALMIDQKIDDGLPGSGSFGVIATSGSTPGNSGATPSCLTNANASYPGPSNTCSATVGMRLGL